MQGLVCFLEKRFHITVFLFFVFELLIMEKRENLICRKNHIDEPDDNHDDTGGWNPISQLKVKDNLSSWLQDQSEVKQPHHID